MFKSFTENAAKQNWKFGVSWVMQKLTIRVSASMTVRVTQNDACSNLLLKMQQNKIGSLV
jgi:hypothetical protein